MSDQNYEIKRDDEIDLVDILTVLIKRKNIILWIVLFAVVVSGLYVFYSNKKINYTIKLAINLPQELSINENNTLYPSEARADIFLNNIRKKLYERSFEIVNGEKEQSYNFNINVSKDNVTARQMINITLTGKKERILEMAELLYNLYSNFEKEIEQKNEETERIADSALQTDLKEKTDTLEKLKSFLSKENLSALPQGAETPIINATTSLISEITRIKRTIDLNKDVKLMKGDFFLIRENDFTHMESVNPGNLSNLESYLKPAKSLKRRLLPVVVSVFLGFFMGILLAFVVEFFSREDVKKRLREASNQNRRV